MYKISKIEIRREYPSERQGEPFKNRNKVYIWIKNETILENLVNRRNRPYTEYKKEVLPKMLNKLKDKYPEFYNELKDAKWGWRQSCGCSVCPCSPGFVSDIEGNLIIHIDLK